MTYSKLKQQLYQTNFTRVERDDRLLDVFPEEIRAKGVELWEQWNRDTVKILRLRLPYDNKMITTFTLNRRELEHALLENSNKKLADFQVPATYASPI